MMAAATEEKSWRDSDLGHHSSYDSSARDGSDGVPSAAHSGESIHITANGDVTFAETSQEQDAVICGSYAQQWVPVSGGLRYDPDHTEGDEAGSARPYIRLDWPRVEAGGCAFATVRRGIRMMRMPMLLIAEVVAHICPRRVYCRICNSLASFCISCAAVPCHRCGHSLPEARTWCWGDVAFVGGSR